MIRLISKIPAYIFFRRFGYPRKLPINLTLSLSYNCNSHCKTCNIYKKKSNELSLDEWKNIFNSLGKNAFWVTISGGEPFLRPELEKLIYSLYDICSPAIINIPTNGFLKDHIVNTVTRVAAYCKNSQIVINVSLDEIGDKHDTIRGLPGSYDKAVGTFLTLKQLNLPNLSIGIHTVISKFNVARISQIYAQLRQLKPDSYITEIAEQRQELDTKEADIVPEYNSFSEAIDFLSQALIKDNFNRLGKITRAFRLEYYRMVKRILIERRQIIPCYAGFASAQISPDGDVWMCCIKAESIGNLRNAGLNFKKIWFSDKATTLRRGIRARECHCPLANASYTNILLNFKSLYRVIRNLITIK
ncbi:MAG: radical SAM protein [Actinomycetota bacterium]